MSDDLTGWNENSDDEPHDGTDEAIYADAVGSTNPTTAQLAARTVDAVLGLLRRANRLGAGVLMIAGGICLLTFLLGLAALDGGARTAWILFGGLGVFVAIGSVVRSMWRLSVVGRSSDRLTDEVQAFIKGDSGSEQTLIQTVQVTEESGEVGVVQVSRQFSGLRSAVDDGSPTYPALTSAMRAITGFPVAMLLASFVALTFIPVALIFLLILIF
ncbi:hypothetical protein [Ilumatobacter nonamiensis]|uniref:hypothetical protein n=1 Tax=Ilumatobacter nonamiensis TaxID=467093 RepID=UPI0003464271|nr:hypothetical protein [Ilumatobacter nonamiensis]